MKRLAHLAIMLLALIGLLPIGGLQAQEEAALALDSCRTAYYQQNFSETLNVAAKLADRETLEEKLRAEAFLMIGVVNVDLGSPALGESSMRTALTLFPQIRFNDALFSFSSNELFYRIRAEMVWDLKIVTNPSNALLFVDDRETGKTPVMLTFFRGKSATLTLKNPPNHNDTTFTCGTGGMVPEDQDSVYVPFSRSTSRLIMASTPTQAEIYLNNEYKGTTPDTLEGLFRGETHTVVLKKLGFNPVQKLVSMDSVLVRFNASLPTATGFLILRHDPAVARVTINGQEELSIGEFVRELPTGSYALRVYNPGYKPYEEKFELKVIANVRDTVYRCIEMKPASHMKSVLLSLLWPGSGQYYSNRPYEAILFSCLGMGAMGNLIYQYNNAYSFDHGPSTSQRNDYLAAGSTALIIHAVNVLDSWLFFPKGVKGVRPPQWKKE